jgi:peptide chain release factor subunit 1
MPQLEDVFAQLDRLATIEPGPFPVVSLYLNLQSNDRGRDQFEPFLRREFDDRVRTYAANGRERQSLERDAERIRAFVNDINRAANGAAIFASSGADIFEAVELAAPVVEHQVHISDQPHLYPLARVLDEYPRYAVLVADSHIARIIVLAGNAVERAERVEGTKTRRHKMGGWSQARYQRHIDNYHLQHVKEVVDALNRVVNQDAIESVVLAGDDVIVPLLREHLPKPLAQRVVDRVRLDIRTGDREVLEATIGRMREKDAQTDHERVDQLLSAYRGNGLAVVGVDATRQALEIGQADQILIAANPQHVDAGSSSEVTQPGERSLAERAADTLVAKARQTGASVRFIEDGSVLANVGGVGALLRFKL